MLPGPASVHRTKAQLVPWQLEAPGERAPPTPLHSPHPLRPQLTSLHTARPGHLASVPCLDPEMSLQSHGEGVPTSLAPRGQARPPCPDLSEGVQRCAREPRGGSTPGRTCSASAPGTDLISLPAASPPSAHGQRGPVPRGGPRAGDLCLPALRDAGSFVAPSPSGSWTNGLGAVTPPSPEQ